MGCRSEGGERRGRGVPRGRYVGRGLMAKLFDPKEKRRLKASVARIVTRLAVIGVILLCLGQVTGQTPEEATENGRVGEEPTTIQASDEVGETAPNRYELLARHPFAGWLLFAWALAESSFFPIPPDALLIAMALMTPSRAFLYAAITSVASVLGGMLGYLIGYWLYESIGVRIIRFYKLEKGFDRVSALYRRYAGWAVGTAGFTPLPYKLFTIAAGAVRPPVNFTVFVVASIVSRSARFFLVATLMFFAGSALSGFIRNHLALLSIAFVALLVLGFVVIKKFIHHAEKSEGESEAVADEG